MKNEMNENIIALSSSSSSCWSFFVKTKALKMDQILTAAAAVRLNDCKKEVMLLAQGNYYFFDFFFAILIANFIASLFSIVPTIISFHRSID